MFWLAQENFEESPTLIDFQYKIPYIEAHFGTIIKIHLHIGFARVQKRFNLYMWMLKKVLR